jgi:putative sigma-54 modulation protein
MQLAIHGKNIEITEAIREYISRKLDKVLSHFDQLTVGIDVHLSVARNPRIADSHSAEVTVYANGTIIRAEERTENLYASIDLVSDKLHRQLRKYKERLQKKPRPKTALAVAGQVPVAPPNLEQAPSLPREVVRTKYFAMPPMTTEEAADRLALVGHDFFMFRNVETGEINVLYERNHGGYGVIVPRN